jgi:WD40 repeat protein
MASTQSGQISTFGLVKEVSFNKHISAVKHLVQVEDGTFGAADDTTFRIWNSSGEVRKITYSRQRRGVICSLAFLQKFSVFLSAEVDLLIRVYGENLEILDSFHCKEKFISMKSFVRQKMGPVGLVDEYVIITGGKTGLRLWTLRKSERKRPNAATSQYPYFFELEETSLVDFGWSPDILRRLQQGVSGIQVFEGYERVAVWTDPPFCSVFIFDFKLQLVASGDRLHQERITSVDLKVSEDGTKMLDNQKACFGARSAFPPLHAPLS